MHVAQKNDSYLLSFAFLLTHPVRKAPFLDLNRKNRICWKKERKNQTNAFKVTRGCTCLTTWGFSGQGHFAFVVCVCVCACAFVCHCCSHTQRKEHFAYHTEERANEAVVGNGTRKDLHWIKRFRPRVEIGNLLLQKNSKRSNVIGRKRTVKGKWCAC